MFFDWYVLIDSSSANILKIISLNGFLLQKLKVYNVNSFYQKFFQYKIIITAFKKLFLFCSY
jgi:hypothetical protein